eukprot:gb/GECG01011955.1/.p1 GENE.gb/GECG01011955.1/~~gb/GECG01011955.1/.p1  ORF type:complete len:126 (+),score=10.43 gb/GECG01011955.1/:1-378(+)
MGGNNGANRKRHEKNGMAEYAVIRFLIAKLRAIGFFLFSSLDYLVKTPVDHSIVSSLFLGAHRKAAGQDNASDHLHSGHPNYSVLFSSLPFFDVFFSFFLERFGALKKSFKTCFFFELSSAPASE